MRLVIVETPFRGETKEQEEANVVFARACLLDCLLRGEAPFASHLLYTQPGVLLDSDPGQRARGIEAGLAWGEAAEATVVYTDLGISAGMQTGIDRARRRGHPIEFRTLKKEGVASSGPQK